MSTDPAYRGKVDFHWDHLVGCFIVTFVTVLAIGFDNVVWLYDAALETERLLTALRRVDAPFGEVIGTAPPGQGLIAIFVVLGDGVVGRMSPGAEITHDILRVLGAAFVTYECLSALGKGTRWNPPNASRFYSISFTFLVALGPFALLLSQVGVSTMLCLAIAASLLRVVFGLAPQREHVGVWEQPICVLIIVAFAGWPGVALALLLCAGCLAQAFLSQEWGAVVISGFAILLDFGIAVAVMMWAPGWPAPARTWAMPHVVLAMGLPFIVVAMALLAPEILRAVYNLQQLTLRIMTILALLALVVLAIAVGGNLLAVLALLMLAYAEMWGLSAPSFTHATDNPYYRPREKVWAIMAWLIGPIAVIGTYALSAGAVWGERTIVFSVLFWALCLAALAVFVRLRRNQGGSRWALILTSLGAVLFVGGVASVPMREAHGPAPVELAQQIWSLCRDHDEETPPALVDAGIDPLTQRRLSPARRRPIGDPIDGVDVLHIRHANTPAPKEGAIDLVQIRQPGRYVAAIAAPSEAARNRCGSG